MTQVSADAFQNHGSQLNLAHDRVAVAAEQTANPTGVVVMVDDEFPRGRVAEEAPPTLQVAHLLDFFRREVVLPLEPRSKVLLSGLLGVAAPPLAKSLVAACFVRLAVVAVAAARARATFETPPTPIGKLGVGQRLLADTADIHRPTMTRSTDMHVLDQCGRYR